LQKPATYAGNTDHEGNGERTAPGSFPDNPFLLISSPGQGLNLSRREIKAVQLISCRLQTVLLRMKHMHVQATKYEWHDLPDSSYELNTLILYLKLALQNVKTVIILVMLIFFTYSDKNASNGNSRERNHEKKGKSFIT
jgi:hypothetical protein